MRIISFLFKISKKIPHNVIQLIKSFCISIHVPFKFLKKVSLANRERGCDLKFAFRASKLWTWTSTPKAVPDSINQVLSDKDNHSQFESQIQLNSLALVEFDCFLFHFNKQSSIYFIPNHDVWNLCTFFPSSCSACGNHDICKWIIATCCVILCYEGTPYWKRYRWLVWMESSCIIQG